MEPLASISCLWFTLGMNRGGRELLREEAGSQTKPSIDFLFRTVGDRIATVRLQRGRLFPRPWPHARLSALDVDDTSVMNSEVRLLCWSKIICICLCLRRLWEQSPVDEGIETIVLETQGPRSVCQCGVVLVGATFWLACYFFLPCSNRTGRGRGRKK